MSSSNDSLSTLKKRLDVAPIPIEGCQIERPVLRDPPKRAGLAVGQGQWKQPSPSMR